MRASAKLAAPSGRFAATSPVASRQGRMKRAGYFFASAYG